MHRMKNGTKMLNLMYQRKKAGLTQEELAEKVGVKRMTIYNYEAGIRYPTPDRLKEIARVLGCSLDDLI